MTIGDRIRSLRKDYLKVSQTEFGDKIGLKQTAIGMYENNQRSVADRTIMLICSEFHVCEEWLRDGTGPMFEEKSNAVLEKIREEYDADALDLQIIEKYLRLKPESRKVLKEYIISVAEAYARSEGDEDAATQAAIDLEVEDYRRELEAERLGKTSEASPGTDCTDDDSVRRRPRELRP